MIVDDHHEYYDLTIGTIAELYAAPLRNRTAFTQIR